MISEYTIVTVLLPNGQRRQLRLPYDEPIADVVLEIVSTLGLPTLGADGRELQYILDCKSLPTRLDESNTLRSAGIGADHELVLTPVPQPRDGKGGRGSRISVDENPLGIDFDVEPITLEKCLNNEVALRMMVHQLRYQLKEALRYRGDAQRMRQRLDEVSDQLKENSFAIALFVLSEIFIGLGSNMLTAADLGFNGETFQALPIFSLGLVFAIIALYFACFDIRDALSSRLLNSLQGPSQYRTAGTRAKPRAEWATVSDIDGSADEVRTLGLD